MFKPSTIKAFSIVAIVLSCIGLALIVIGTLLSPQAQFAFFLRIVSWVILLWASYIGFRLCSYKLYEEEYKKVGIRIYLIIAAFILFFFVGIVIGLILSVVLLSTLWGLKRNYDEWDNSDTLFDDPSSNDQSSPN